MNYMVDPEQPRRQSHPRLTIIDIVLMIFVGAIIIILDRNQVRELAGKADWSFLVIALSSWKASAWWSY
jgi:hypothetical protein